MNIEADFELKIRYWKERTDRAEKELKVIEELAEARKRAIQEIHSHLTTWKERYETLETIYKDRKPELE